MPRARRSLDDVIGADWTLSDMFTDRLQESSVFAEALAAHRRRLDSDDEPTRGRNVLVFHGYSGLGKSELSRRLEAWSIPESRPGAWSPAPSMSPRNWGPRPGSPGGPPEVLATARIDLFQTQGYLDGARVLAELRIELGSLKERWPLFDLAFAAYWAATHPGEDLPVTADKKLSRDFSEQVTNLLSMLSEEAGQVITTATMAIRFAAWLRDGLGKRLRRHGIDAHSGYNEFLRRCAAEPTPENPRPDILAGLAHLLAYEIDQPHENAPLVVVFVDTFERLRLDPRGEGEALLNRVVWEMDNVLFVVTGQWPLRWADANGTQGLHRGPTLWPLLLSTGDEEPRQHALDHLSDRDRRDLLARVRSERNLPLTDDVLEAIAERSGGLPEYLRLAVEAARVQMRNGQTVTADTVSGNLETLVRRLFEDVPSDEQKAVRAAALFRVSYVRLVAAAAGVDEGAAELALARPFFDTANRVDGDRAMHDTIRDAIRAAGQNVPGGWSEVDWNAAGTRALRFLRVRHREVKAQYATALTAGDAVAGAESARMLLRIVGAAVGVVCEVEPEIDPGGGSNYDDWLSEAVVKGPSVAGLRPFVPARSRTVFGNDLLTFITAKSTAIPHNERVAALERLAATSVQLGWIAGRHLGYALRDIGRWDDALQVFDSMVEARPADSLIVRQRWSTIVNARHYSRAIAGVESLDPAEQDRLRSSIDRDHGLPERWMEWAARRLVVLGKSGSIKDALELEGGLTRWRAFLSDDASDAARASIRARAAIVGHDLAIRDTLLADILVTGRSDRATLDRIDAMDRARLAGDIGLRSGWARAAMAYAADDEASLAGLADEVGARAMPRDHDWIPVEALLHHLGHAVPEQPAEWLEPDEVLAARWIRLWEGWRARVRTSGRFRS